MSELDALNSEFLRLSDAAKYADAIPIAEQAAALTEKAHGPDHPDVGQSLNELAALFWKLGRYAEAEPLYQRSLAIWEKALGSDHTYVGTSLNNLAALYRDQGRYADAEPLYKRSLAIWERALGPDHPDVGTSLNNLAALYRGQGRTADAEPLYRRSLGISEKALGPDHPDVGQSLNGLASLYYSQGRITDAEPLLRRSLAIWEMAHGPDHPDVGTSLNNLAALYRGQGRYADAEPLYLRSLAIREKVLGPDHPEIGSSLNGLAELYRAQSRYAEAEPFYRRSLAIWEKALGPDHRDIGASLNNLAALYENQGRTSEAEPLYRRSLAISEKALGPDHPDVRNSLNNLATLYESQGRIADAEPLRRRIEAIPGWEVIDIPILFATNRGPEVVSGRATFGATQQTGLDKISFGKAIVRAPKPDVLNRAERLTEALGQLNRATGRQTSTGGLAVRSVDRDADGTALATVALDRLSRAARFPSQAFVFVHGYNSSFEDAVRRTAMIAFDLDFDGATYLFTWPSQAKLAAYRTDRKRARIAAPFLLALLHRIGTDLPGVKLHLLAHSTGAEIVLSALTELAGKTSSASRPLLGELILAHADVDPARLARVMPSLEALGLGVTSYSSAADWAMRLSRLVRLKPARVGSRPVNISGVDAIDVTGLSGGPLALNHTVFVDNPMVFGDMARLMATGERPPDKRTSLFSPTRTRQGTHWEYRSPAGR